MVAKFFVVLALVAVASASDFSSFAYSVADPYTGDFKNQIESRLGDNVNGQYSLLEADGTRRTVDYAAGAEGFNAVVRKDPALIAGAPIISHYAYAPIALKNIDLKNIDLKNIDLKNIELKNIARFAYAAPFPYAHII